MKYILITFILLLFSCTTEDNNYKIDKQAITQVMKNQEKAWSNGDIDGFMEGYWKSDSLTFIGSKGPTYGWKQTLKNYKKGYKTKDEMGTLTFETIELTPIANNVYYMIGKYTLTRKEDTPTGYFSLLWKKINTKWVIISDHTSG